MLTELDKLFHFGDSKKWSLVAVTYEMRVFSNKECPELIYTQFSINAEPELVTEVIWNGNYRKQWEPHLNSVTSRPLPPSNSCLNDSLHLQYSPRGHFWRPQDFYLQRRLARESEDCYTIRICSETTLSPSWWSVLGEFVRGGWKIESEESHFSKISDGEKAKSRRIKKGPVRSIVTYVRELRYNTWIPNMSFDPTTLFELHKLQSLYGLKQFIEQTPRCLLVSQFSTLQTQLPQKKAPVARPKATIQTLTQPSSKLPESNSSEAPTQIQTPPPKPSRPEEESQHIHPDHPPIWDYIETKYVKRINEIMDELMSHYTGGDMEGWKLQSTSSGVEVRMKTGTMSSGSLVKGTGTINAPPSQVADYLGKPENRTQWDSLCASCEYVRILSPEAALFRMLTKAVWPTAAREIVLLLGRRVLPTGELALLGGSIDEPITETKGAVRAWLSSGGFIVAENPSSPSTSCIVTYVMSLDLKGSVPSSIVSMVSTKQPLVIDAIRKILEKQKFEPDPPGQLYVRPPPPDGWVPPYTIEKTAPTPQTTSTTTASNSSPTSVPNSSSSTPATSETTSQSTQQSSSNQSNVTETSTTKNDTSLEQQTTIQLQQISLPQSQSQSQSQQIPQSQPQPIPQPQPTQQIQSTPPPQPIPSPNQSKQGDSSSGVTGGKYSQFVSAAVRGLLESYNESAGWATVGTLENILMSKRVKEGSSIHSFKSVGEISASPKVVLSTIKSSKHASEWDNLMKEVKTLEKVDDHTEVLQLIYHTQNCLMKLGRDFCVISHWFNTTNGTIVYAIKSIEYDKCQSPSSCSRGTVESSGFIISPKGENGSLVTYISQVDLSQFPIKLVGLVGQRQTHLIASVRKTIMANKSLSTPPSPSVPSISSSSPSSRT